MRRVVRRGQARRLAVAAAVLGLAALTSGAVAAGNGGATAPPCVGSDLSARFKVEPGSAGAGQISYTLRVRNLSPRACFVSGLPRLRLLGRHGQVLPTHVVPAQPGATTAVKVVLGTGDYASATARFSPDVPGVGEQVTGPCEPKAYDIRVKPQPGGVVVVAPVSPPTPVCEHGRIVLSVFVAGRTGPQPS